MARECLNQRIMIITSIWHYDSQDEQEEELAEPEEDVEYPNTRDILVVIRMISVFINPAEKVQREKIFHTRCTIENKVCNLIIDGDSWTNWLAST